MAQVTKTVDKTLVNGSETFVYTFNVSYNGLIQPAQSGILTDFFPSKIKFVLPQIGGQIKNIISTPVSGGTQVTFDFGQVHAGTSLSFTVAASFGPGRVNNDSFTNIGLLFADDVQVAQGTAPPVNLILDEDFILKKESISGHIVRPDQELTFTLTLINQGDAGAEIENINLVDTLPPQLIPLTSFLPIGTDVSVNGYADPTYNGKTGLWSGSTLNFNLPSFKGNAYQITFKATVANDVTPGEAFTNTAEWTVNGVARQDASYQMTIFTEADNFNLYKGGNRTGSIDGPIKYLLSNVNRGLSPLNEYILEDILPAEVDITKLSFTSLTSGIPTYSIFIALSDNPNVYIPIVQNVTGNTPSTLLTPFIPVGEHIVAVRVSAPVLNVTNSNHTLNLAGTVNHTAVVGQTIINEGVASSGTIRATVSYATILSGASDLSVQKSFFPEQSAYYPLEEFKVILAAGALNTFTVNPIFADLLPIGLRYVLDSEYFTYTDNFSGIVYDSRNPDFPVPLPTRSITDNFAGTGQTLLRWSFDHFTLPFNDSLKITFTAFVEIHSPNYFVNTVYLGNPGDNVLFIYDAIADDKDYDHDGITDENISSVQVSGIVLTTSEFSLKTLVKGTLDLEYLTLGNTVAGGDIAYQLLVTNNQEIDLKDIELVDILPWVGDTGVILTEVPRNSQFAVYATSEVTAEIINILGEPVDPNPQITIAYSTSNDPMRFDQLGNPIGTGTWSLIPPTDITTLRSIKVTTGPNVVLKPYERLIVQVKAKAPVGALANQIAYNSFAVRANKMIGGDKIPMLPTEPNKVGVRIAATTQASIGQFVWADYNQNGLYEPGEPGVNGITVQLYDQSGNLLGTTVTSNNNQGEPGYYLFNNLTAGDYLVQFIPYGEYTLTQQQADQPNGSKPNPINGLTDSILLSENEHRIDINAGVLGAECDYPLINAHDRCIYVSDPFDPMLGVTATDCRGTDLTSSMIITQNTVNTQVPGLYSVTYQVTDDQGQTTSKTISVKVCAKRPYEQQITDLMESIALEQTALAHILNAEGEKIQKAMKMNLSLEQTLAINKSVKKTVNAISFLEIILQGKLALVDCQICKEDCCK